jgi:ubiquinone/menaquinone biosynthesis C-methylase UbiE
MMHSLRRLAIFLQNRSRLGATNFDRYERIAPLYDLLDLPFEYSRYRKIRPLLFKGLEGRVLDAGVGTGRNIPFYPPEAQVVGIDISPAMLARAERRRLSLGADVKLHQMDVTHLAFEDQSFDAAVATFLFCVLSDDLQVPALRELCALYHCAMLPWLKDAHDTITRG